MATFSCKISGDFPIAIQWTRNGDFFDPTTSDRFQVEIITKARAKILRIFNLTVSDNATYGCQATNVQMRYKQAQRAESSVALEMVTPAMIGESATT